MGCGHIELRTTKWFRALGWGAKAAPEAELHLQVWDEARDSS